LGGFVDIFFAIIFISPDFFIVSCISKLSEFSTVSPRISVDFHVPANFSNVDWPHDNKRKLIMKAEKYLTK
jgi:hypothetical protein